MNYFKITFTDSNRLLNKYITLSPSFTVNEYEQHFGEMYVSINKLHDLKIQVVNSGGTIARGPDELESLNFPLFWFPDRTLLIRNDIYNDHLIKEANGIQFYDVGIYGNFNQKYKLLCFSIAVNCIDNINCKFSKWNYEPPILLRSLIPNNVDGFFLSGWHSGESHSKYNLHTIVSEDLMKKLLQMDKAKSFLKFSKLLITEDY